MMLNLGTDCSGICAASFALRELGLNYHYKFASEINTYARKSLIANHNPEIVYEDMTAPRVLPKIDLYISGFPCQPFSAAGKGLGPNDTRAIFPCVLDAIFKTEPSVFILENVKRLTSFKEYFSWIINSLGSLGYEVNYSIMNTSNYGIPQNRERIYIIGTKGKKFKIPAHLPLRDHYIEEAAPEEFPKYLLARHNTIKDTIFCNVNIQRIGSKITSPKLCNTITACGDVWFIPGNRKATINELLALQGFPIDFVKVVSNTQVKKQVGNAMSVNVVREILKSIYF